MRPGFDHIENGGKQDGKEKDKEGSADSELEVRCAVNAAAVFAQAHEADTWALTSAEIMLRFHAPGKWY